MARQRERACRADPPGGQTPEEEPATGTVLDDDPLERSDAGQDGEEEDEGHFEPPPPPPLPKLDLPTKLAWVALFGGPAYLLVAAMASWHMEGWALFTAVAAFIGGSWRWWSAWATGRPTTPAGTTAPYSERAYDFDVVVLGANDSTTSV
ncbi:hypothetical protein ACFQQB_46910 [Nonomuraea rubra]|uniref:hypothetical protein n=1 Tax=Nonomuraea rubra TaxID=46180 RepID=UPI0036077463